MSVINLKDRNIYKFKTKNAGFEWVDRDNCEYTYEKLMEINDDTFSIESEIVMESMSLDKNSVVHFHLGEFIIDLDKVDTTNIEPFDLPKKTIEEAKGILEIEKRNKKINKILT